MKFLFPTEPDDEHSVIVKLALEEAGHEVRLLFTADQPTKLKNSIHIDNNNYQWKSDDSISSYSANDYDVVWWRRIRKPYIPENLSHPEDYKFIERENRLFLESITYNMAPYAWWVNNKEAALRAHSKILQLKIAVSCGLPIPVTLCSNDPIEIRYFLLKYENMGVIYKPLSTNFWVEEKKFKISYTHKVDFLSLPENATLQSTPGIFQQEIKKKYELRITCFGEYLVAAKIHSQLNNATQIDWRAGNPQDLLIEPYILSTLLEEKIRLFMRRMNLIFGCIDMIIDENDQPIFLEVNEQGQFLWKENYHSDFKMLDIFIKFLSNQSSHFHWDKRKILYKLADYEQKSNKIITVNKARHVYAQKKLH